MERNHGSVKYHFRNEKLDDVFIWMDFVCVDQHQTNDLDFKDWSQVFQTSLEQIGKAVIAVVPAEKPIVATRCSWCCFEMTQMVRAKIKYDICISPNDTQKLIKDMQDGQIGFDKWNTLFSLVNVEKSIATKSSDQVAILVLMKDIGIVQVNNVVLNALKKESTEQGLVKVLNARAALHQALGDFDSALPYCQGALKVAQAIPDYDSGTATCLNNLAQLLKTQGKFDEAKSYYEQALGIWKKVHGEAHPLVATGLNNLAGLLRDQGKFDEAEPLYRQAIAIGEKTLGMDHPDVANWLNNLAQLLSDQGKFDEAEPYYEQAVSIWKQVHGEAHPLVATGLNNLAVLLEEGFGDYEQSKKLKRQALANRKKVLGDEHPDVAQSLNNLAVLLRDQGKESEVRQLGKQAYAIALKSLGKDHPDVINAYMFWETF